MSAKAGHLFSFSLTQLLEDIACWYMHKLFAKAEIFTVQLNSGIFFLSFAVAYAYLCYFHQLSK